MTAVAQFAFVPSYELTYESKELPKVRSRPGDPVDSSVVSWLRETALETPLKEVRSRFNEDGYVFIKGLIPREDVLDMRER